MYAGDTKNITISVTKDDGTPLDLTGCTITWVLKKNNSELVKTTTNGVIGLVASDTSDLNGIYPHECELTDQTGNVSTIFIGKVTIEKYII
jgi:outer membrane lipoprotein-sorting protein